MRWRITLYRIVGSKRLLRSILQRAGVDETVRRRCWLQASWSQSVFVAVLLPAMVIEKEAGFGVMAVVAVPLMVCIQIAFHRTLIAVGESQISIVESARVTVLSSSSMLLLSQESTSRWSKRFDIALTERYAHWDGQLSSEKDFTTLEAEWQRLGLPSKSVLALP